MDEVNPDIRSAQIRAARALLDWSQGRLAHETGVSRSTIADLEANKRVQHPATVEIITTKLVFAGVEFSARGVSFTREAIASLIERNPSA